MEATLREARVFQQSEKDEVSLVIHEDQVKDTLLVSKATAPRTMVCYRCGNNKHGAAQCPRKDKQCNNCGKMGHLARVCQSRSSVPYRLRNKPNKRSRTTHLLEADIDNISQSSEEDFFDAAIHSVAGSARYKKLVTSLTLNGTSLKFEVDTGAELSTIPWATSQSKLQNTTIQPSSVLLHQYDDTRLPVKGEITVQVSYGSQAAAGSFVIDENANNQLPLVGSTNWRELFQANKHDDPRVSFLQSTSWINEFPNVIKDGLGLLKGIKVDVELESGARAKFCKSEPIPFSLKEQVEKAIQQQIENGELMPVESSELAAPIVLVIKKDGGVRICADFKVTINPH